LGTKCQGTRGEDTATKAQRNVRSQICTCLSENFIPGLWIDKPSQLPEGAKVAHKIITKKVAGCPTMCPVDPGQIINYDTMMTANYFYRVSNDRRSEHDEWVRISNKPIQGGRRKTVTPYYKGEEETCNGLMVRWLDCTAASSGDIFPIVLLICKLFHDGRI
jgi:hypothetical protein